MRRTGTSILPTSAHCNRFFSIHEQALQRPCIIEKDISFPLRDAVPCAGAGYAVHEYLHAAFEVASLKTLQGCFENDPIELYFFGRLRRSRQQMSEGSGLRKDQTAQEFGMDRGQQQRDISTVGMRDQMHRPGMKAPDEFRQIFQVLVDREVIPGAVPWFGIAMPQAHRDRPVTLAERPDLGYPVSIVAY